MIPLPSYSMIADLLKNGATLEAQEQIMKLREAALELQEENLALREELRKRKEERQLAESLEFADGVYWLMKDGKRTGPFCPRCYDEHYKLIRLHSGLNRMAQTKWLCLVCENTFD